VKQGAKKRLKILQNLSGIFLPGSCSAILGSSGSGKTSFLDIVASNKTRGVSGSLFPSPLPALASSPPHLTQTFVQERSLWEGER